MFSVTSQERYLSGDMIALPLKKIKINSYLDIGTYSTHKLMPPKCHQEVSCREIQNTRSCSSRNRTRSLSLHLSHHLLGPSSSRQARPGKAGPCLLLSRALPQLSPSRSPPGHHSAFLATVARNIPLQFRPQNDFEIKFVLPLIVCRQPAEAEGTRSRNNGSSTTRSMRRSRTATGQGHPRAFLSTAPKQFQF